MSEKPKHNYDESKVKTLSSLEHIRLRTGMYIGRIGNGSHHDDGCYILLKEIIDNAIDEYIMGFGKEIELKIEGTRVAVRDFGRGIPLGKVVDCVSTINTGAKYNDDVFQFSVGLNGVGTKAVNALSDVFRVRSYRGGEFVEASFKRGKIKNEKKGKDAKQPDGTYVEFEPDATIFKETDFKPEHVERRLRHYSYLNTGLKLILRMESRTGVAPVSKSTSQTGTPQGGNSSDGDRRDACPTVKVFQSRHGLMDLVMEDLASDNTEPIYPPLHYSSKMLEFCFTHSNSRYGETFYSFVNGQYTSDGGTHLSAFREGLLKAVNEYSKAGYEGDDVRECMVGAVSLRLKDPVSTQQTDRRDDHGEGCGHAAVAEGIAGGQEARARAGQGHHAAHPAVEGLQKSFRQEEGKGQGHDGVYLRRPVRRRLDHQLP